MSQFELFGSLPAKLKYLLYRLFYLYFLVPYCSINSIVFRNPELLISGKNDTLTTPIEPASVLSVGSIHTEYVLIKLYA